MSGFGYSAGCYQNENNELVEFCVYTNARGDTVQRFKIYQNNGRIRIKEFYEDGTTTETFESQEAR